MTSLVIFALGLAVSRYGRVRLGDDDSAPAYSGLTWFGMLFAAGGRRAHVLGRGRAHQPLR
ncbi:BCCT family transporter [Kocuria rhizophila]|nr:BCCT family transporter [Kocuria rhizophila]